MSDGCQANTSTFARRKATSALSYLLSRVALMVKVPPVPSSFADTFLVAGGGPRALAGLGLRLLPPGSFSGKSILLGRSCRIPVNLVGANKRILLVAVDSDDAYRPRHLQHVVGIVGSCHELGEGRTAKYSIVGQWNIGDVKSDALSPEVELPDKGHRQSDLSLGLAPSRVDSLE